MKKRLLGILTAFALLASAQPSHATMKMQKAAKDAGFPAANSEAFKETYPYDVEKAKQLLAEAGYPNGEGFPKLVLNLRDEPALPQAVAQAYAAAIKDNLGIEVETTNLDRQTFMSALQESPTGIQFGLISYGMDYLDPSNMLGVFKSGGRHSWSNPEFDALTTEARQITDADERLALYQQAIDIMRADTPAIPLFEINVNVATASNVQGLVIPPNGFINFGSVYLTD